MAETRNLKLGAEIELNKRSVLQAASKMEDAMGKAIERAGDREISDRAQKAAKTWSKAFETVVASGLKMKELEDLKTPTKAYLDLQSKINELNKRYEIAIENKKRLEEEGRTHGSTYEQLNRWMDELPEKINNAKQEMQELVNAGKAFDLGVDSDEYNKLINDIASANNVMREQLTIIESELSKIEQQEFDAAEKQFQEIDENVNKVADNIVKEAERVAKEEERLARQAAKAEENELKKIEAALNSEANNIIKEETRKAKEKERLAKEAAAEEKRQAQEAARETENQIQRVKNSLGRVTSSVISNVKSITARLKRLVTGIAGVGKSIVRSGIANLGKIFGFGSNSADSFHNKLKQGIRAILSYGLGITTLVMLFNKLRNAAGDALQRMAKQIPEVNRDISTLMSALQNWKNAVGTMFQPLLAAITPILTKVINLLTAVTTKVGEFFAALTAQKYVYKATGANIDYAKSLDKSTKSQKKANKENEKALGDYDKLQVIQKNKAADTDAGKYDADAAKGAYKKVPIDPKWQKIADWLKNMWKNGDFFELGAKFAKWMTDLLNKIPWDKIKAVAAKLGKSLATLLNGIFADLEFAKALGRTIGEAFNTALEFAYAFVDWFDFKQFGVFLGTGISEALKTIDWEKLKNLAKKLGKGIADFVTGILETDVIEQIGNALGNIFRTIVDFCYELITNFPFIELGKKLRAGLNNMLNRMFDVDETGKSGFTKLGESISKLITGIFRTINEIIGDAETRKKIGKAVTEFFNGIDYSALKNSLVTFGQNVVALIAEVIKGAFASPEFREAFVDIWGILEKVLAAIIGLSIAKTIGGVVIEKLLDMLGTKLATGLVTTVFPKMLGAFSTLGTTLATGFTSLMTTIGSALSAIGTAISGLVVPIGLVVAAVAIWIKNWDEIKEAGQLLVERTKEHLTAIKESWIEVVDALKVYVPAKFNEIKQSIISIVTSVKNTLISIATVIYNHFKSVFEGIYKYVISVIQGIINAINSISQNGFVNTAKQGIVNYVKSKIPEPIRNKLGLANGAVIPPNHEFTAVLGDQKRGVNIETPLDTMVDAFKNALSEMGGGSSNNQPIVLQLNGRTIAQAVWDEQKKRYAQTGQYSPRMV